MNIVCSLSFYRGIIISGDFDKITIKGSLKTLQMNQSTASHLSDVLSHILNHHLISSDGLHGKQTPVVDVRLAESDLFLAELQKKNNSLCSFRKSAIHMMSLCGFFC